MKYCPDTLLVVISLSSPLPAIHAVLMHELPVQWFAKILAVTE